MAERQAFTGGPVRCAVTAIEPMEPGAVLVGDCIEQMARFPDDHFDAIVTDPPYELGFMGKNWDLSGVTYRVETWCAMLRVLKPGGYLLAFGGTRTHHRLMVALEDAGFEIRDCLMWLYGQGFPKSLDISKAIDKAVGVERPILGVSPNDRPMSQIKGGKAFDRALDTGQAHESLYVTAPTTDAAKQWSGWGTALKPAWESIVLARKPLSEKNVAANVLRHGTGGINVDGCRIGMTKDVPASPSRTAGRSLSGSVDGTLRNETGEESGHNPNIGRWPANVTLTHANGCELIGTKRVKTQLGGGMNRDGQGNNTVYAKHVGHPKVERVGYAAEDGKETVEDWRCVEDCPVRLLDEQSGDRPGMRTQRGFADDSASKTFRGLQPGHQDGDVRLGFNDSGGASRFFYCAKASRAERGESNQHPTVKPIALMRYLIRLVTPPGGLLLDPFCGSGTTLVAAAREGMQAIGIDKTPEYVETAQRRLAAERSP